MKLHYHILLPMDIDLLVCEYVPMITAAGYEENYDWLELDGNQACFLREFLCAMIYCHITPYLFYFVLGTNSRDRFRCSYYWNHKWPQTHAC